jgi:hypothetical protein
MMIQNRHPLSWRKTEEPISRVYAVKSDNDPKTKNIQYPEAELY